MKYASIDLETTGLNPNTCDIVEIGVVIDDLSNPQPYDKLPRFHAYILPSHCSPVKISYAERKNAVYQGEPYALGMHATIFKRIAKKEPPYLYLDVEAVVSRLQPFFSNNGIGRNAVFVGKNFGSFDLPFLLRLPNWDLLDASYRVFDPTALYVKVGEDLVPPSMAKCLERAGLNEEVTHNAVDDALQVVKLMRRGLLGREAGEAKLPDFSGVPVGNRACTVTVEPKDGKLKPVVRW